MAFQGEVKGCLKPRDSLGEPLCVPSFNNGPKETVPTNTKPPEDVDSALYLDGHSHLYINTPT